MKQRLIDADALREQWLCLQGHDFSPSSFVYSIDNAPTVDAVPVVRCGKCANRKYCEHPQKVDSDWFCADGERTHG